MDSRGIAAMQRLHCLLLGISLLPSGFVAAQDLVPPKINGVVKQVDIERGTVTVRPTHKGAAGDETFSFLKKDIDVTSPAGEKTRLDAIEAGHTIQLKFAASGDVEAIVIQSPVFLATVLEIDTQKRTITIERPEKKSKTMAVPTDAKILLADRTAYLREVKPGSAMNVTTSLDGKRALGLKLVADPDGKYANKLYARIKVSRLPGTRLVGLLTDIDPAKSEVKLVGPKTKGLPKSFPVAKDAFIRVLYGQVAVQELPLKQIAKMAHATVLVSPENQQITHVFVTPPAVSSKVKSLDGDGGHLTIELNGTVKTFALRRDFKVMNGTRVKRLQDLHPNLEVKLVLSLDREELLAVDLRQAAP
jgi:hypothetical protein